MEVDGSTSVLLEAYQEKDYKKAQDSQSPNATKRTTTVLIEVFYTVKSGIPTLIYNKSYLVSFSGFVQSTWNFPSVSVMVSVSSPFLVLS